MQQVVETETVTNTNTPTPSRTIRVTHDGDYTVSVNHGVSKADNGRSFLTFTTLEEAITAFTELRAADIRSSYLTYSLFVKSQTELTEDSLRTQVLAIVPSANLTYVRVDSNNHTGKVVVDILTDYQTVKASSGENLKFFHFDPKRVRRQDDSSPRAPRQYDNSPRAPRQYDNSSRPPRQYDNSSRPPRQYDNSSRPPRDQDSSPRAQNDGFQQVRSHNRQGGQGRGGQGRGGQGRGGQGRGGQGRGGQRQSSQENTNAV